MTLSRKVLMVPLVASVLLSGCLGRKKAKPEASASAEPDKVLYERATDDIRRGKLEVGRLTLETLLNTYPDSEYLAKAKLAIADSYYREGGLGGLAQAIKEYKDFITFFPFLDEAAYAQMQVAMAHYRQMEKPDRDRTEARLAEEELQTFLQKHATHPLAAQAEQRLREVQEVLADGEYRIARFYHIKGSYRASGARLLDLATRYPLYSQADRALWMLASIFERAEKSEFAAQYYSRIVREYPLSGLVDDAKARLTKLGVPIPQPSDEALARMQKEHEFQRQRAGLLRRSLGMFKSGPDVSMAAHSGKPNLTPPSEASSPAETITAGGPLTVGATTGGGGSSAVVETVVPGSPGSTSPPEASSGTQPTPAASENPPKADPNSPEAKPGGETSKNPDKKSAEKKDDKKKESSSKKKKGLRKIIPW